MCQQFDKSLAISSSRLVHDLPARNYRRQMKPVLPRKVTASARINLNKFWNDLEEFYNRYDDRRLSNNNNPVIDVYDRLPAYTTDTYDHDREAAENDLNERMEAEKFEGSTYVSFSSNLDLRPSSSSSSSSSSSFDDDQDSGLGDLDGSSYYLPNATCPTRTCWSDVSPRPPRNLLDLIQRISSKH